MSIRSILTSTIKKQKRYPFMSAVASDPERITVRYLVVAGGGSGGQDNGTGQAGGGGGGGLRTNFGTTSGRDSVAEPDYDIDPGSVLPILVGAGSTNGSGGNSTFGYVTSVGGGRGGNHNAGGVAPGGCGGGAGNSVAGGAGTPGQGYDGRTGTSNDGYGGGGTTAVGLNADAHYGYPGLAVSITGSAVTYGSGGGGTNATYNPSTRRGVHGSGDGGQGTSNTTQYRGYNGIVIFRVPTGTAVSFSGGVTYSMSTVDSDDVYSVTATSTVGETVTIG